MENISNLQIMQLSKSITSKESAEGILANFLPVVENATLDSQKIRTRSQDNISKALLPSGFDGMVPLSATTDGNCLFHSASILLSGDESLAPTLRMLTASELFAYSEFYSTRPQLTRAAQAADYSIGAVLNIFLSNRKAEKVFNGDMNSISRAIEMLAQETATPSVYASPFVILALASVLGKPVFSIYPDVPTSISIKRAIHGVFHSRQAILAGDLHQQDEKNEFLYIMWTRSAYSPLFDWKPNHFVPLVPLNKPGKTPGKSYSDAVKCKVSSGRGRASQSSFFQYESDRRRVPPTSCISVESDEDSTPPSTKENHKKPILTKKTTSFKKSPTTSNVPLKDQRSSEIPCGTTSLPKCKEPPLTSASSPSTKQNHKKPNSSNKTTSLKNSSTTSNAPFKDRCSSEIPHGTKSVHQREWEAASTEESSAKMRKLLWGLKEDFVGSYREDYQVLQNTLEEEGERTSWMDHYSTTVFNPDLKSPMSRVSLTLQPIPDYVRWLNTGGKLHFMPYEKMQELKLQVVAETPAVFLPSKILEMTFKIFPHGVDHILPSIAFLTWITENDVQRFFKEFEEKNERSFLDDKEREYWNRHELYREKDKAELQGLCRKKGLSARLC